MTTPPARTSLRGPKILTFAGVALLLATVALGVLVARLFLSVLPLGVVDPDGGPGPDAVGGTDVPGTVTLTLDADTHYGVFLAHPSGAGSVALSGPVTITGPDGEPATASVAPSTTLDNQGVSAHDVAAFRTGAAGEYTIDAPALVNPSSSPWATVVVAEQDDLRGFFGGIFGTIAGVFVALGAGLTGLVMVIGGAIWWHTRARARDGIGGGHHGTGQYPGPGAGPGQYPGPGRHPGPGQYPGGHHPGPGEPYQP